MENTDYINASLVVADLGEVSRKYILTQGPLQVTLFTSTHLHLYPLHLHPPPPTPSSTLLQGTTGHFWSMVWQQGTKAVIMLNRVIEKGTLKCHQYWPAEEGEEVACEAAGITVANVGTVPGDHYNITTLRITHLGLGESREVLHFHYTTWPDFGVPTCPDTFLQFLGRPPTATLGGWGSLELKFFAFSFRII